MDFVRSEELMKDLLVIGTRIRYQGVDYVLIQVGKPASAKGEPKTDIYAKARAVGGTDREFKISYKQPDADFLENKMSAERAEQVFGGLWRDVVRGAASKLGKAFYEKPLIYLSSYGRTRKGSITLGWKFDLWDRDAGDLSCKLELSPAAVRDVYAGTHLDGDKKDALVNGVVVPDSGIANYMLVIDPAEAVTSQKIFDTIVPIGDYCREHPSVYCAFKAHNYRTLEKKDDGNRPLGVYVNWDAEEGKLCGELSADAPLETRGVAVRKRLLRALEALNVSSFDQLTPERIGAGIHTHL
ncbi:MAG: hypothetical protein ACSHYA_15440 [Opitutaceae bacterium]